MTRDAKIGLLLGLVFIFVIAFIINGLPSLCKKTSNEELTRQMLESGGSGPGIAQTQRKIREIDVRQSRVYQWPSDVEIPRTAEQGVRFSTPLPKPPGEVTQETEPRGQRTVATAQQQARAVQEPAQAVPGITQAASVPPSLPAVKKDVPKQRMERPKPEQRKLYVVRENDNLALIAKKFYGAEEGNRQINIDRIYKANRKILRSPDEIYVDQKLTIPPLPVLSRDKDTAENVLPAELFEKTESVGKHHLQAKKRQLLADKSTTPAKREYKLYVVKEGDSLWKIAAEQLGSGGRYKELTKLNARILEDEDNILVGTRLRIPLR